MATYWRMKPALACACFLIACGGDDGDGDASGDELTLDEALETAGSDTSDERAELVFEAACTERSKCTPTPDCVETGLTMWNGSMSGRSEACLDATLDLYACFATEPCADYDEVCNDAGQRQKDECGDA